MNSLLALFIRLQRLILQRRTARELLHLGGRMGLQIPTTSRVLLHSLCRQDSSLVMDGCGMVSFVNRNRGVDIFRLDGLLLDDGLDMVVNVVLGALSFDYWCGRGRLFGVVGS